VEGDRRINKKEVSEDKNASQRHWALQRRLRGRGAVGMHRLLCQRGGDAGERGAAARGATTTTSPNLNRFSGFPRAPPLFLPPKPPLLH
jgi:hypothetical protein